MAEDLPNEFDLIVIGTGFPESVVAAAASRIGKSVLHIDPNEFYGGAWASFNLEALNAYFESLPNINNDEVRNVSFKWHIPYEAEQQDVAGCLTDEWTQSNLLQQSRRFNIDLSPKILYSSGRLVQLLVSSNICRYAEFRAVDRVCTRFNDELINVPCSRSDVFNTKDLTIVEKRLLMKFLTTCLAYGENQIEESYVNYRGQLFCNFLKDLKVTPKIVTCIMQAIAMADDTTTFEEGMERTQRFLTSLGRYGNTPFLFPMYGCGEIPQCFCRLCAVFGGVYCLKRSIDEIHINADTNTATVIIRGHAVTAKHVVASHGNLPANVRANNLNIHGKGPLINCLSRGIFITSTPLGNDALNSGGGGVNLLRLLSGNIEAIMIQLSHYSGTCPKGLYIFHITTPALSDNPEDDLNCFITQVFNEKTNPPKLLYSAFFTLTARAETLTPVDASTPLYCTAAPYYELDYDRSIQNAQTIFSKIYNDLEFLPRAPDPEEIVIDGEDPRALSETSLPDDLREQLRELNRSTDRMELDDSGSNENVGDDAIMKEQLETE